MMIKKIIIYSLKMLNTLFQKKNAISFCSNPDFSDNSFALYKYIAICENNRNYRYYWHIQEKHNKDMIAEWIKTEYPQIYINTRIACKGSIASVLMYMKSRIIVSTHGLYSFKTRKQKEVLLWHGMPLKKIGYLNDKDVSHGVTVGDYYSVTSHVFAEVFQKVFRAASNQIFVYGQPRNDLLLSQQGFNRDEKVIIFLPTFRNSNSSLSMVRQDARVAENTLFNLTKEELVQIEKILECNNTRLIIKPHPLDTIENENYINGLTHIQLIDDHTLLKMKKPLYELVAQSNALITDYSSIFIDYLLTNRPIAFFVPDFEEYKSNRGFIFDINEENNLPGVVCQNADELISFIEDITVQDCSKNSLITMYNEVTEPTACKNVFDNLIRPNMK